MPTPLTDTHHSRVLGSYYGALVGNALGAPYEFKARDSYIVDSEYVSSTRSGVSMPPGAWTDDSSMMLCLLESLLESGCKWDVDDCVRRWIRWMSEGYMTVVDESLDMGMATLCSLESYQKHLLKYGRLPDEDKLVYNKEEKMSGNGSLMRLCPVPLLLLQSSPSQIAETARATSLPTHASPLCIGSCALLSLYIYNLLHSTLPTARQRKLTVLSPHFDLLRGTEKPAYLRNPRIEAIRRGDSWRGGSRERVQTTGFVIHTLEAALWALHSFDSFEEGMMTLLKMGGDVDTVCCVYGQIAGACYGLEGVSTRWINGLAKKEMLDNFADRMLKIIGFDESAPPPYV